MTPVRAKPFSRVFAGVLCLMLGLAVIAFGWLVPSRFKSVPYGVVREAGQAGETVKDRAKSFLLEGNLGASSLLSDAAARLGERETALIKSQIAVESESNPQLARWGTWDPFLEAGLGVVPLERYSDEPGLLGVLLAQPCRDGMTSILQGSRSPTVAALLASGNLTSYRKLYPVSSMSGRPLEVTVLSLGLAAQGEHMSPELANEVRGLLLEANQSKEVGALEDFYLDTLSLIRIFNWGQFKETLSQAKSVEDLRRLRFLLHKHPEKRSIVYAFHLSATQPSEVFNYLERYGKTGFDQLEASLAVGINGYKLALREQLPIELETLEDAGSGFLKLQSLLAPFSLRNPELSLGLKYGCFFLGAFLALYGLSRFGGFYREKVSPVLALTQRFFGATAAVLVFAVLSEPYLAQASSFSGYNFRFVMPVLTSVDGELQVIETTPSTSMEPATLLSIAFFFLLQALVFLICMLKVREIERRDTDPPVKLKLMENEENLFDSGLYVGIAGTCISLVMQVIDLVEANLLAAYSSNLFGILCVAIVKIRLVRPYKTQLILRSEQQLAGAVESKSKVAQ